MIYLCDPFSNLLLSTQTDTDLVSKLNGTEKARLPQLEQKSKLQMPVESMLTLEGLFALCLEQPESAGMRPGATGVAGCLGS